MLKRKFPDELLKKAEKNVPALEKMRQELLHLASEAASILARFRELVLIDREKNELDRLLEGEVAEYESCL